MTPIYTDDTATRRLRLQPHDGIRGIPDKQGVNVQSSPTTGRARPGDARARRTRRALNWSLIELVLEQGYAATTVQDIAARAAVGRSTFYAHFSDKDDAFLQHFMEYVRGLGEVLVWEDASHSYRLPMQGFCSHLEKMRPLVAALTQARRLEPMCRVGRIVLAESLESRIARDGLAAPGVPVKLLARFIADAFINLPMWWMAQHDALTPREMDEYFHRLVAPGMAAAFGDAVPAPAEGRIP